MTTITREMTYGGGISLVMETADPRTKQVRDTINIQDSAEIQDSVIIRALTKADEEASSKSRSGVPLSTKNEAIIAIASYEVYKAHNDDIHQKIAAKIKPNGFIEHPDQIRLKNSRAKLDELKGERDRYLVKISAAPKKRPFFSAT